MHKLSIENPTLIQPDYHIENMILPISLKNEHLTLTANTDRLVA